MAKIKYNIEKAKYKLKLTQDELDLILKFCSISIIGNQKDCYQRAATNILRAAEESLGNSCIDDVIDMINIDAVIQHSDTISGKDLVVITDENVSLRISEK